MKADLRALAAVGLLTTLAACQSEDYPPTPEGHFLRHCSRCHEPDGSSATATDLAGSTVDLRAPLFQRNVTDLEIARIVVYGQGKMQGLDLEAAVVDSIVAHVRTLSLESEHLSLPPPDRTQ